MNFILRPNVLQLSLLRDFAPLRSIKISVENHGFTSLKDWNRGVISDKMFKDKLCV